MKILISDDHGVFRQGLRALIEKQADVEIVGEAEDGRQAVQLARELAPDVVIMDITMPKLNGVEATREILNHCPETKVLVLSMHADRRMVREVLDAGASGYILKSSLFEELIRAIEVVRAGECYLSPRVASGLIGALWERDNPDATGAADKLTPREQQVLRLVADGETTKQIAHTLRISPKTADAHRRQAMDKLGILSIAELTKFAIREGWTSVDA